MAGERRQALLRVIDEAAGVAELQRTLSEKTRVYQTQRAQLRELDGRLNQRPELDRRLGDLKRKLNTFEQSRFAEVLKGHQRALRQRHQVDTSLDQLKAWPDRIRELARELVLEDWPEGIFAAPADDDVQAWRADAGRAVAEAREALDQIAQSLESKVGSLEADQRLNSWRRRVDQAQADYDALQARLEAEGVEDPQAFGRLVQERQQVEAEIQSLEELQQQRDSLHSDNEAQWRDIVEARRAITVARADFLARTLEDNQFVRMAVVPFGSESQGIERELRRVLEVEDDRFDRDILSFNGNEPAGGLAHELAQAGGDETVIEGIKERLLGLDPSLGGHFRNYLQRKLENVEFADRLRCWFPEDDLRIDYSRGGDGRNWRPIRQGSQGERSAALLAFLLAFGDEPLVLDQPEDDLDNHLIYRLIVRQIRESKLRRQLVIVTHNPNIVVNGDAEMVHAFDFRVGQCRVIQEGALQEKEVRDEVCEIMEGGREAFRRRWARLGQDI